MASMRARRPGRTPPEQKSRRVRRPPPPESVSRLAAIKLSGGLATPGEKVSRRDAGMMLAGVILFAGAAIAGATWIGGSLFDAREAFARSADGAAAEIGFAVNDVEIAGIGGARAEEVRAIVVPDGRRSLLSLDPYDVKARVESLDWVQGARVTRLWPSTLRVQVTRRQAFARWQEDGEMSVIDANGERLFAERAADHADLPLVVGRGAGPAAEPLLRALEELPELRGRLDALVRVEDRRWNLELTSGMTVELPEAEPAVALARLEDLQARHRLLDRPLAELDLRAPGRIAIRVHPQLAGGPRAYTRAEASSAMAGGA